LTVEVSCCMEIGDLKQLIQVKRAHSILRDIDPHTLELWKVNIDLRNHDNHSLGHLKLENLEDVEELKSWITVGEYWSKQPLAKCLHIILNVRPTTSGRRKLDTDITIALHDRWSKRQKRTLPLVDELSSVLDEDLSDDEKVPLTRSAFNVLLSKPSDFRDICTEEHLHVLFRVSEEETSHSLSAPFYNAVLLPPPPDTGTEASFIPFWQDNIGRIMEQLIPDGCSIRDSSYHTSTRKLRPDYGFVLKNVCPFRGEEKSPSNPDDPREELYSKLAWTYYPAPYVFGYYSTGCDLTLVAICAPRNLGRIPYVRDLATVNLRFRRARIINLRRMINLSRCLQPLVQIIEYHSTPEFVVMLRDNKSIEIGINSVKKSFSGPGSVERIRHLESVYKMLVTKNVPYVDKCKLTIVEHEQAIYLEPKGFTVRPSTEVELLQAIVCVLRALQVLHKEPPLYHRDIRWENVMKRTEANTWFLIDWDDAAGSDNKAASHLCPETHCPTLFKDGHGAEVDVWGVGFLISAAHAFVLDMHKELKDLGKRMLIQGVLPTSQDALDAVMTYISSLPEESQSVFIDY